MTEQDMQQRAGSQDHPWLGFSLMDSGCLNGLACSLQVIMTLKPPLLPLATVLIPSPPRVDIAVHTGTTNL